MNGHEAEDGKDGRLLKSAIPVSCVSLNNIRLFQINPCVVCPQGLRGEVIPLTSSYFNAFIDWSAGQEG